MRDLQVTSHIPREARGESALLGMDFLSPPVAGAQPVPPQRVPAAQRGRTPGRARRGTGGAEARWAGEPRVGHRASSEPGG